MAMLGKAKVLFSSGKYAEALQGYQHVLERSPSLIDPDPRIGIGCCLWQLGHKEHAKLAWERSLQLVSLAPHAAVGITLPEKTRLTEYRIPSRKLRISYWVYTIST